VQERSRLSHVTPKFLQIFLCSWAITGSLSSLIKRQSTINHLARAVGDRVFKKCQAINHCVAALQKLLSRRLPGGINYPQNRSLYATSVGWAYRVSTISCWYFGEVYGFETCRGKRGIRKREHVAAGGFERFSDNCLRHCHAWRTGPSNPSLEKAPLVHGPPASSQDTTRQINQDIKDPTICT